MIFIILTFLIISISIIQLSLCPFTKVEESFNLHAIHDFLHLSSIKALPFQGDHVTFTGPIPRTFVGSLTLATLSSPIIHALRLVGLLDSKLAESIVCRALLGSFNCLSIIYFGLCCRLNFGDRQAALMILICCSQFHLTFYSTRTLPNMFAFSLVQVGLGQFLLSLTVKQSNQSSKSNRIISFRRNSLNAFSILTFTTVVFRLELIGLVGGLTLVGLFLRRFTVWQVIGRGFLSAFGALELTVPIDSYFWQKLTWPEGSSVFFNVVQGNSKQWGVMPWHFYFTSSLPKLLGLHYLFGTIGFFLNRRVFYLGLISIGFLTMMSLLGHKEARFIIYIVPIWNLGSAIFINRIIKLKVFKSSLLKFMIFLIVFGTTIFQTVFTTFLSINNYVGGRAMVELHSIDRLKPLELKVHLDNLVCQTGASRFLQLKDSDSTDLYENSRPTWTYDKLSKNLTQFDIIVSERRQRKVDNPSTIEQQRTITDGEEEVLIPEGFRVLKTVPSFKRIKVGRIIGLVLNNKILMVFRNILLTIKVRIVERIAEGLIKKYGDGQNVELDEDGESFIENFVEFDNKRVKIYVNNRLNI
ncbi:Alg9-like mannosyltransferase family-domain-containing protein [Phakopsora pachyrhizi]|uniref:Mannosyltransferase n=1 Tax=Phakopsora pachyrhizi TaxID=170000 RepID=A0AAV0BWP1_PHAPC|nr:Alg9-like mannosyltransferase family-domain-containing protein [Phakopsora pachyrhizi]